MSKGRENHRRIWKRSRVDRRIKNEVAEYPGGPLFTIDIR